MIELRRRHNSSAFTTPNYKLPAEYQQVEYLECDGKSQIVFDGGFELTKSRIRVKYMQTSITGFYSAVFSGKTTNEWSANTDLLRINDSLVFEISGKTIMPNMGIGNYIDKLYDIEVICDNPNFSYSVILDGVTIRNGTTTIAFAETIDDTYYLMRLPQTYYYFIGKFYEFEIENEVKAYHFIPCYRKTDNVAGLYDVINNQFYTNAGTGEFIVGPDVN